MSSNNASPPQLARFEMSTAKPTKPETTTETNKTQEKSNAVPTLGALDEDDEFEEFETDGMYYTLRDSQPLSHTLTSDWPEEDTMAGAKSNEPDTAGHATVALDMSGSARSDGNHLWEDNWDDDDIEDDFSVALRYVALIRQLNPSIDTATYLYQCWVYFSV